MKKQTVGGSFKEPHERDTSGKTALLKAAYALLEETTPKRYDCGRLCGSLCCRENASHGEGEVCGMLLLPGEKELLSGESYRIVSAGEGDILECGGFCRRSMRPFACRIFPFYPKITRRGSRMAISLCPDPRAGRLCPILKDPRRRKASVAFLRAARRAVRILVRDEELCRELLSQSEMLSDMELLKQRLFE